MENKMLDKIFPPFRPLIEKALISEYPGGPLELVNVTANRDCLNEDLTDGHFFMFRLPFAGTTVQWDLMLDAQNPERPPDFVCAEDIDYDPEIYSKLVKSWDLSNHESLVTLIKMLTKVYRNHQLAQLNDFKKAADVCSLLVDSGVLESNIQFKYLPLDNKFNILVKLDVRDEDLPIVSGLCSSQSYAGLLYSLGVDGKVISHSLVISPYFEHVLGPKTDQLRVPSSQTVDPCVFHDFTASLQEILDEIREENTRRRHIMAALRTLFPDNFVDYDNCTYSQATLLFTLDEARYVVRLKLKGEMQLELFAMDRFVKLFRDEIMYSESEPLVLTENPSSPDFAKYLQTTLVWRITQFAKRSIENAKADS